MKIIVRQARDGWIWAFVSSNGKQTANNETHPTKANAIRAAKGVVIAILRQWYEGHAPRVVWTKATNSNGDIALTFEFEPHTLEGQ